MGSFLWLEANNMEALNITLVLLTALALTVITLSTMPLVKCYPFPFDPLTKELFLTRCNKYVYISAQR